MGLLGSRRGAAKVRRSQSGEETRQGPPREPVGFLLKGRLLYVAGVVKGLEREGERTRKLAEELSPDAIGLPLPLGEVRGLQGYDGRRVEMSKVEEAYAKHLGRWGKVSLPPPPYLDAVRAAARRQLPVYALDMDEESYSSLYVEEVTGLRMIAAGVREDSLAEKEFAAADEFEFSLEWDRVVNLTKGHRRVEEERERHIAGEIVRRAAAHERLLAVVEYERLAGMLARFEASGAERLEEF
jgi:hypothetical protein